MKTSVLKKSLLDYAIKGHLSAKWRRANPSPNAFDEIESYNAQILKDKKTKEQERKELETNLKTEKDKETKQALKQKIQNLKKDIAKLKTIVPLKEDCAPFSIPPTWEWVRLGDIVKYMQRGKTPIYSDIEKYPVIAQKCIQWSGLEINRALFIEPSSITSYSQDRILQDRDILLNSTGTGTLGRVLVFHTALNPYGLAVADGHITIIRFDEDFFIPEYFYYFFSSAFIQDSIEGYAAGTTKQKELSLNLITNVLIPFPPLSEQKQIVSILDSLIGLADSFDKTKEELKRIEKRIEKSLLQHAILGKLSSKWRRDISASPQYDKIPNAFDEIESYNAQILKDKKTKEQELKELESNLKTEKDKEAKQALKQKIQNLKKDIAKLKTIVPLNCHSERSEESQRDISLVSQAQYDNVDSCYSEPSLCHSDLECNEREESKRYFANAQYDKETFIPPFAIPKTWSWVRLGEVCEIILGKTPPREIKKYWNKSDYYWVSIGDMQERAIITQTKDCISEIARQECFKDYICKKDTLILSFKLSIGKVSFLGFDGFHNEGIVSIIPKIHRDISAFSKPQYDKIALTCHTERSEVSQKEKIFKNFLSYFLPLFTKLSDTTGAIKGETLNKEKLNNLFVALPPLSEQQEIVQTLDALFALTKGLRVE